MAKLWQILRNVKDSENGNPKKIGRGALENKIGRSHLFERPGS
jgi:hypothetical protein